MGIGRWASTGARCCPRDDLRRRHAAARPGRPGRGRVVAPALRPARAGGGPASLLAFVERLGVDPRWIQNEGTATEHFDLREPMRQRALALGAVPVRYGREVARITMAKREVTGR
ncbi:DUF4031 domain-containing protein [Nocardioides sp. W3-2-3]|uniref:DUF4031 domain-containing protein n=1 Tax=Nocardioides convexus TaxID=2712224 RepID=UPI0024184007|nr:DUF4031 domain-containing protein [Nocardioides convexus]NHA00823.1 DUF4031 domain-containing protein [Nocardioides convexus]